MVLGNGRVNPHPPHLKKNEKNEQRNNIEKKGANNYAPKRRNQKKA